MGHSWPDGSKRIHGGGAEKELDTACIHVGVSAAIGAAADESNGNFAVLVDRPRTASYGVLAVSPSSKPVAIDVLKTLILEVHKEVGMYVYKTDHTHPNLLVLGQVGGGLGFGPMTRRCGARGCITCAA